MQSLFILTALMLVARVSAEHVQEVSNVQTVPAPLQVDQPSHVVGHTSAVESGPQQVMGMAGHQFTSGSPMASVDQGPMPGHYYSPAGMIHVVGEQQQPQQAGFKPAAAGTVRHYAAAGPAAGSEQYGQPESASIPPNYKPFGSWGLYIGGNPADGYYTNYYKALSNSVADKQQVTGAEPASAVAVASPAGGRAGAQQQAFVGQASGFGQSGPMPTLKQGPFYPTGQAASYQDQAFSRCDPYCDYYSPADLNSGSRVTVHSVPSVYSGFSPVSSPSSSPSSFGMEPQQQPGAAMYFGGVAPDYAPGARKTSQTAAFAQKEVQAPSSPAKGFFQAQQRSFYAAQQQAYQQQQQQQQPQQASGAAFAAPSGYQQQQQQQAAGAYQGPSPQVVAYPVPVGSQMVGSQPGVEGAFQPYGVHAFTRYAVKPTVVNAEQSSYYPSGVHSAPASQFPVYKQQFYGYQQPMSFYGYPINQLHYSSGAFAPAQFSPSPMGQSSPVAPSPGQQVQQQVQQQQQAAASFSAGAQAPAPAPMSGQVAPVAAQPAPVPVAPQAGPNVVESHSGPVAVVQAHGPAVPFETASSEKSETSEAQKDQFTKQKVQQQQQQQQKSN